MVATDTSKLHYGNPLGKQEDVCQMDFEAIVVGGPSRPQLLTATTAKYQMPLDSVLNS